MSQVICPNCRTGLPFQVDQMPSQVICTACTRLVRPVVEDLEAISTAPRDLPELPNFTPQPCRSDNGLNPALLPVLIAIVAVAAVAGGWLASFIGQWFYLVLIFPAAVGGIVAAAGFYGAKLTHMRNGLIAGLLGLGAGVLAIVAMHWFDYQRFLGDQKIQPLLQLAGRKITFPEFIDISAKAGVRISDMNLGFVGTWIYWIVELIVVALIALAGTVAATTLAYCSNCNNWKTPRILGRLPERPEVVDAVQTGNMKLLAECATVAPTDQMILTGVICPNCAERSPIVVTLQRIGLDAEKKPTTTDVLSLQYPGEALPVLETIFYPRATSETRE